MNLFDLGILLAITLFALTGFRNGIVREVLTIIGLVAAVFVTFRYMDSGALFLEQYSGQPREELNLISGLILFSVTFIFFLLLSALIRRFLEVVRLNMVNRILGLFFGGLKAGIVISAVLILLSGLGVPGQETRSESVTYPWIIRLAPAAYDLAASVIPGSDRFLDRIQDTLDETYPFDNQPI